MINNNKYFAVQLFSLLYFICLTCFCSPIRGLHQKNNNLIFGYIFFLYIFVTGIVLVALNPYQSVPLYGQEIISAYSGKQSHEIDPHIYAVAENAYRSMVR